MAPGLGGPVGPVGPVDTVDPAGPVGPVGPVGRDAGRIVEAMQRAAADGLPLVILHHGGVGAAVGRSLAAEYAEASCLVVEAPATADGVTAAAAAAGRRLTGGYTEIVVDGEGTVRHPVTSPLPLVPVSQATQAGALPLRAGDVCVVTGGAKGIGAECALALAAASGARLVLLGRARPDTDPEVAANLDRFQAAGVEAWYRSVDVTDAAAVARELAGIRAELGPVRGVLHCAGRNDPARIEASSVEKLRATLAPKAAGLENVLHAVDPGELRMLVTFGSVIGRIGLAGESDYAIANEWLARRVTELARELPVCRCLDIEWSVWSGAGMGQKLGVLDALVRQGVTPIPVGAGVAKFLRLLADPATPPVVMVAGRLPSGGRLAYRAAADREQEMPLLRWLEEPAVSYPGVELVADARLSLATDGYLADHMLDQVPLLPAVVGLEAMAQAVQAVTGLRAVPSFSDVRLSQPVTAPPRGERMIRLAALAHDDGRIEVVLRSAETGFAVDHFAATCHVDDDPAPEAPPEPLAGEIRAATLVGGEPPEVPAAEVAGAYYGGLFFHGPAFRRLAGYPQLSALGCHAEVIGRPGWAAFGHFLPQELVLGDFGARDAYIHVLQACVPHRRVLPVAVDEIRTYEPPGHRMQVRARERSHGDGEYTYDFAVEDENGKVIEEWRGLHLRDVGPLAVPAWTGELLGPYLARVVGGLRPGSGLDVTVRQVDPTAPRGPASEHAVRALAGEDCGVRHTPAGRLELPGRYASASHAGDLLAVAIADVPVAVDAESAPRQPAGAWRPLLGLARWELAELVARRTGEGLDVAATRVWTALETLSKLGAGPSAPLTLTDLTGPAGADWLVLRSGDALIANTVVRLVGGDAPLSVAVCLGGNRHA